MHKSRLEAFSDGVIAIIITIMVLELRPPHESELAALAPLIPKFVSYVLSFIYLGIYWNNHHHLWQVVKQVNGRVLWANLHLLFWLSLIPFVTSWMGENNFSKIPVLCYGVVLIMAAVSYYIMVLVLLAIHQKDSTLAKALGNGNKEKISLAFYAAAILLALFSAYLSLAIYALVAVIWFVPDQRIEKQL
jgi:uncharacterized membrane protein